MVTCAPIPVMLLMIVEGVRLWLANGHKPTDGKHDLGPKHL
ncbi:MAG TPA: hypothetical protein VGA56_14580 [Opitutaceae bacterium]